jgi:hypothetical protein
MSDRSLQWTNACVEASKPLLIPIDISAPEQFAEAMFDELRLDGAVDPFRFVAIVAAAEMTA